MDKLNILVVVGTARKDSYSEKVAKYIFEEISKKDGIQVDYLDIKVLDLKITDDGSYKVNSEVSKKLRGADGLLLVVPEYNQGYPGSLKMFLDSYFDEYLHKAVGLVGVSSGVFGGARAIHSLVPVLRRLGMVALNKDLNVPNVKSFFDEQGQVTDKEFLKRLEQFMEFLEFMSRALKEARKRTPPFKEG